VDTVSNTRLVISRKIGDPRGERCRWDFSYSGINPAHDEGHRTFQKGLTILVYRSVADADGASRMAHLRMPSYSYGLMPEVETAPEIREGFAKEARSCLKRWRHCILSCPGQKVDWLAKHCA
jgi:hypothetical protein